MNIVEYCKMARSTAMYPNLGDNIYYPTLGLIGECSEMFEKIYFDDPICEIIKEMGDVLWYVSNLSVELGTSMDMLTVYEMSVDDPIGICGFIDISKGRISEAVKKTMRDDDGVVTETRLVLITYELSMIISYLTTIATVLGTDLEAVMQGNVDKLQSRKTRGVLTGSGDNR